MSMATQPHSDVDFGTGVAPVINTTENFGPIWARCFLRGLMALKKSDQSGSADSVRSCMALKKLRTHPGRQFFSEAIFGTGAAPVKSRTAPVPKMASLKNCGPGWVRSFLRPMQPLTESADPDWSELFKGHEAP